MVWIFLRHFSYTLFKEIAHGGIGRGQSGETGYWIFRVRLKGGKRTYLGRRSKHYFISKEQCLTFMNLHVHWEFIKKRGALSWQPTITDKVIFLVLVVFSQLNASFSKKKSKEKKNYLMLWHTCPIVPDFSIKIVGTYFMAVIIPTSADLSSESLLCLIRLNKMLVDSHYLSTHYCEQYSGTHLMHYIVLAQFIVWNCKIFFYSLYGNS